MKTDEVRQRFLEFFEKKGHRVMASDSLVPQNDPTLLFTGAGMNQFKEYFLGIKKDIKRAASSQKCLRTGDLDEVGRTPYHHSFFEMLGNFSFGDYFKEEAIRWAWEFLTEEIKLPKDRLRISVHRKDEEAFKIWRDRIKIREDWIYKLGDKTNFWPSQAPKEGPNGPCGPCSEIYYDQNPKSCSEDISGERFAEIWNLVFTQFDRQEGGRLVPLGQKNIDTGMGLERLACVIQNKTTNFETDLFTPLNESVEKRLKVKVPAESKKSLYAISDHLRAAVMAMADGVIPSNEGRGYVIRKLIRRALWHAHELLPSKRLESPFLYQAANEVVGVMRGAYPDLVDALSSIQATLHGEEKRFLEMLETGLQILEEKIKAFDSKHPTLPGEIVFELYDTYGFPDELTKRIATEKGLQIDQKGFDRLMAEQRKRAKEASQIASHIFVPTSEFEKRLAPLPDSRFLGYQSLESHAQVLLVEIQNRKGVVVLDQTPFYAESGGQVGDQGILENKSFRAQVTDTQKKEGHFIHSVDVEKGGLKEGEAVEAKVDRMRRERAMRNHTATHLLHAALREILGKQVRQLGSLVGPEKLRFDYSYSQPLTEEQGRRIEVRVNEQILKDTPLTKEEKRVEEAKREGAIAFFGEKYGERVRVVTVPDFSKELCGGTHCERTGQIGAFLIVSDSSIGSGVRRLEALTGEEALSYTQKLRGQIAQLAQILKVSSLDLLPRVTRLQETARKMEKGRIQAKTPRETDLLQKTRRVGSFQFLPYCCEKLPLEELRHLSDRLRSKAKGVVYLLASKNEGKVYYLLGMTPDLKDKNLDLLDLFKRLSTLLDASGGGRKDLVQGGGTNLSVLEPQNWDSVIQVAVQCLEKSS